MSGTTRIYDCLYHAELRAFLIYAMLRVDLKLHLYGISLLERIWSQLRMRSNRINSV